MRALAARNTRSLILSAQVLAMIVSTLIVGNPATSLAQEPVKATDHTTGGAAACSATEGRQADASQCAKDSKVTPEPQGAIEIYSNLGPSATPFDPTGGLPITGPSSSAGTQAVAFPFTSKTAVNLEGIELPAGWYSGLNSVYVCIYADESGLPGEVVECITIYNLYPFGEDILFPICIWELPYPYYPWPCVCIVVWPWDPFPLAAEVRYWVVVYPDPNEPDFWGYWYYNYEHKKGEVAIYNQTTGAWETEMAILPAVALYGK